MKKLLFSISIGLCSFYSSAQVDTTLLQNNIPSWAVSILEKSEIAQKHQILTTYNPFYFEADLTGDKLAEIAFLVENKVDHTNGVLIIEKSKSLVYIVGCGNPTEMGSSLAWTTRWFVYRDKVAMNRTSNKKVMLDFPALQLVGSSTSTLIIYWTGKKFKTFVHEI